MRRREMVVEHRINLFRIGYFVLFAVLDSVVGFQQYQLGAGLLAGGMAVSIVMIGFFYFIHRHTAGPVYRPWIKYLAIGFDYAILAGAIVLFHEAGSMLEAEDYNKLAPYFRGEWSILFALMFILINFSSGLRYGGMIVLYSTILALVANGYILVTGNISGQLLLYTMVITALSGVITYFISQNISQLFIKFLQRKRLMRFLSRDMVARLDAGEINVELGGEMREVTILISDLRGFTSFSESRDPQLVVKKLNEYFTAMTEVIFHHGGTIDKFLGDGILAVFGAPVPMSDHARGGVLAAQEMQGALVKLNQRWVQQGHDELKMGIGLHTGEVLVGNVGSPERMEYTVIGDPVNLTSRIEGLTKTFDRPILFSEKTRTQLSPDIEVAFVTETQVRGRDGVTRLYSI